MKKLTKIFAATVMSFSVGLGFTSCDTILDILLNDATKKENEKENETPEEKDTEAPVALPESVGEDPFAGKTIQIGTNEFDEEKWAPDPASIYAFGDNNSITITSYSWDYNLWEPVLSGKTIGKYSYDTAKKELYVTTKEIVSYCKEWDDNTGERVQKEISCKSPEEMADKAIKDVENDYQVSFENDESKKNYLEYTKKVSLAAYNKLFNAFSTLKYEPEGDSFNFTTVDNSYSSSYKDDVQINLSEFNFNCGEYQAATVKLNETKKTFTAKDVYIFDYERGEGYVSYSCRKVNGYFEGTYTTDENGKITSVKITKDVYAEETAAVFAVIDSIEGRKAWTDKEETSIISVDTKNKTVTIDDKTYIIEKTAFNARSSNADFMLKGENNIYGISLHFFKSEDYWSEEITWSFGFSKKDDEGEWTYISYTTQIYEGYETFKEFFSFFKPYISSWSDSWSFSDNADAEGKYNYIHIDYGDKQIDMCFKEIDGKEYYYDLALKSVEKKNASTYVLSVSNDEITAVLEFTFSADKTSVTIKREGKSIIVKLSDE